MSRTKADLGDGVCKQDDCTRRALFNIPRYGGIVCRTHYQRAYRAFIKENPNGMKYMKRGESCSIDDCDRPVQAHGMCSAHYNRVWRYNDPRIVLLTDADGTLLDDYTAMALAKGHLQHTGLNIADCQMLEIKPRRVWRAQGYGIKPGMASLIPGAKHAYEIFCRCQVVELPKAAERAAKAKEATA